MFDWYELNIYRKISFCLTRCWKLQVKYFERFEEHLRGFIYNRSERFSCRFQTCCNINYRLTKFKKIKWGLFSSDNQGNLCRIIHEKPGISQSACQKLSSVSTGYATPQNSCLVYSQRIKKIAWNRAMIWKTQFEMMQFFYKSVTGNVNNFSQVFEQRGNVLDF